MINRFSQIIRRSAFVAPWLRPRINQPIMDSKTRADIRREILSKLSVRMQYLEVPND